MPPKTVTPAKPQKNLFSFFQKSADTAAAEAASATQGSTPTGIPVITPTSSIGSFTKNSDSSPPKVIAPVVVKVIEKAAAPAIKAPDDDGSDSDTDFALALKKKRAASAPAAGPAAKKKAVQEESEDEWMASDDDKDKKSKAKGKGKGKDSEDDNFSLSASESDDDFLADDDDEDEVVKKPKAAAKKPPLPKAPKATAKAGEYKMTMHSTPAKVSGASTPTGSRASPSFFGGTPGYVSSVNNTPMGSASPMTTTGGQSFQLPEGVVGRGSHEHNSFAFLTDAGVRCDADGHKVDDPLYNPRTLKVPKQFLADQTPAMAQWWVFKAQNMDTVLFFKVGKFYELFHMDADVGFSELDLIYMKGAKAHSGFPEVSYGKMASILVSKGYRVARVEQTETPEMLKERNDSAGKGKKDKVVAREMCAIMTRGTRTYCHLDDLSLLEDSNALSSSMLVCIKEVLTVVSAATDEMNEEVSREYGICAVDSIIGTVTLAQFQDDDQLTRLRTFLARFNATEVLLEDQQHSAATMAVVKLVAPKASIEMLRHKEMPDSLETMVMLQDSKYFTDPTQHTTSTDHWPVVLKAVSAGMMDGSSDLVMSALGGALWQLKRSLIDYEVLSMGKVFAYIPPDNENQDDDRMDVEDEVKGKGVSTLVLPPDAETAVVAGPTSATVSLEDGDGGKHMTLDEMALTNLEVLVNTYDRTETGSLWAFLNRTKTPFGKRLLRSWLCHPLFHRKEILARRDAVEELLTALPAEADKCRNLLRQVPDLERLLARVHSNGLSRKGAADHPDNRAVMYESAVYNMRKIRDFVDILNGFEQLSKIGAFFGNITLSSSLLRMVLPSSKPGMFPAKETKELLDYFRSIFNEQQAKKDGNIKPLPGVNPDYDQAVQEVSGLVGELERYLVEMKKVSGINDIKYYGNNKDRFQLEIPINLTNKVPSDWTSKSQKKTHRRYWTTSIERMLAKLITAEERVVAAQKDTLRSIFNKFDQNRAVWDRAVSCMALFDALLALAAVSCMPGYSWPQIVSREQGAAPQLKIVKGRHPMLEFAMSQRGDREFIPNDLTLGGHTSMTAEQGQYNDYNSRLLLLTGPNMGGKSTLLRQTCLLVILAQLGCKVPAEEMLLTPVDRIFTRIGASDRIMQGQSTFYVELAETAMILHAATEDSLCILDELGRGTATFDGTAVAHSVVHHLVSSKRCRALFATHYHLLIQDWEVDPRVKLGHMDCIVQQTKEGQQFVKEEVTFLYKLCDGASPKSYGIHVAQLAGVPQAVLELAQQKSLGLEAETHAKLRGAAGDAAVSLSAVEYYRQVSAVFDTLVSIFAQTQAEHQGAKLSDDELVFLVAELWTRYGSLKSHAQK